MVAEAMSDKAAKETKTAVFTLTNSLAPGASTTVELVELVPGKKIVVTNLNHMQISFTFSSGAVGVEFKSGSTALTGRLTFSNVPTAGTSTTNDQTTNTSYMPDGHFWTAEGEALNLTITDTRSSGSAATNWVNGYINYYEE